MRLLPKSRREPTKQQLQNWISALTKAVLKRSPCWVMPLAKLATKRAADIESKATAIRMHEWKMAIGAKAEDNDTRQPTPTRIAYSFFEESPWLAL